MGLDGNPAGPGGLTDDVPGAFVCELIGIPGAFGGVMEDIPGAAGRAAFGKPGGFGIGVEGMPGADGCVGAPWTCASAARLEANVKAKAVAAKTNIFIYQRRPPFRFTQLTLAAATVTPLN